MQTSLMNDSNSETAGPTRRLGSMRKLILFNNIRVRLLEQLCFLDIKTESHSYLISELSDFFRHRAQVELEHSRNLDKILHCFQTSHNELTLKSSKQWPIHTAYACWHQLINETQSLSYDYATLSEIYNVNVIFKLQNLLRIYKKYHELVHETHEEILRILRNFYTTIRTYNIYQNEYKRRIAKLRSTDVQRKRIQQAAGKEKLQDKKYAPAEKQDEICSSDKLETIRARNVYKHYTETSNATIHKYMLRDLRDIIYGLDSGFSLMVSKAILSHVTSDQKQYLSKLHCLSNPDQTVETWIDKKKHLNKSYSEFSTLKSSKLQNQLNEDQNGTCIPNILQFEYELQLQVLRLKEDKLHKSLEKIYSILDMLEINSIEQMKGGIDNGSHADVKIKNVSEKSVSAVQKNSKTRSESKTKFTVVHDSVYLPTLFTSHRIGHNQKSSSHRPKLFGGSLEEYLKFTNEEIPLIMRSCIRAINTFGLHSQGIFRVSGAQVEILNLRDSFERGEDPLVGATDASDMNSVAGVLKLYLRELEEPLFPTKYFDVFISLIQLDSKYEVVAGMRNYFKNISKPVVVVIRFLFSFLNHLSEYANENMMDAFNLAISFGPTLMPAPEDKKQVQYQNQLNELIKVLIAYHHEVFPKDLGGLQYDQCIA